MSKKYVKMHPIVNGAKDTTTDIYPEVVADTINSESATSGQVLTADGNGGSSFQTPQSGGSTPEVWTYNADTTKFTLGTTEKTPAQFYTYYVANYTTKTIIVYSIESASATKGQTYGTGLIDTGNMLVSLGNVSGDYTREFEIDGSDGTVTETASPITADQTYNASSTNAQSGVAVASAISNLQVKPTITTDSTSATPTPTLLSNNIYRYTLSAGLTSLTISFPTMTDTYESEVVFKSGSTATTFSTSATIQWSGDDVASNTFTPVASKTYTILFWYDGINTNAVVRGV